MFSFYLTYPIVIFQSKNRLFAENLFEIDLSNLEF